MREASHKGHVTRLHPHEMSKQANLERQKDQRVPRARGGPLGEMGMIAKGYECLWGSEHVLKLNVVMAALKTGELCSVSGCMCSG